MNGIYYPSERQMHENVQAMSALGCCTDTDVIIITVSTAAGGVIGLSGGPVGVGAGLAGGFVLGVGIVAIKNCISKKMDARIERQRIERMKKNDLISNPELFK